MKINDLFNSNDYQRGFADGKKDAELKNDKNYIRSGMSLKFAVHGSHAIDTYNKGYNDGYEQLVKSQIPQKVELVTPASVKEEKVVTEKSMNFQKSNFNINKNFSKMQSLETQLEALHQLRSFLNEFKEELRAKMQIYNEKVNSLRENALSREIATNYDNSYCVPNNQKLWQLIEIMEQADMKYINENIAKTEEAIETARLNYNG